MGQELHHRSRQPASPLWSAQVMLDEPELVVAAHRDFIDAGAKVITVNSYAATPQRLARDGAQSWFESLHTGALEAAHQAREQSGADDVRIAGCLPPLVASYHPDVVPDDATCLASYQRIVAMQAERYNRTIRYDWPSHYLFKSISKVQDFATPWLWTYNNERPNMSLGGITPKQKVAMAA